MKFFPLALILTAISSSAFAAAEADLLVAYDNSYSDGVGGDANAEVIAANAVAGSNAINDRSGTGARIRIAGYHKTWWQGGRSTLGGYVGWLGNYGDGNLDDVTAAADSRGADLVSFVCAPNAGETSAAVANQPGRYAAYGPGNFWANIIAHETGGHNYGCYHQDGDDNPKTIMMHNYCGGGSQGFFSNPNIWLNGARIQGTGTCIGGTVNGGDNAYLISSTAQGVADRNARVITAPKLDSVVRRWSFNQPAASAPSGTTITDAVTGTALATVQGSGATFTGSALRIPGGAGGSGAAYLQLPSGLISGYTNVTLEIWAKTLSAQNWARVMDFNNGTGNYLLLSASRGNDLNLQRFESKAAATVTLNSDIPTATGVMYHYAVTFTSTGPSTGRWTWFRDGDQIAWLDVAYSLATFPDVNNWLGRSAFAGDSYANAEYAEVRVSNVAMTRDQIAANARLGPNRVALSANLTADDPIGQNSFNVAGRWSDGLAPSVGKNYETYGFRLRTPADGTSRTFAGQSLTMGGGGLTWKGTSASTITVSDLTLAGTDGEVLNAGSGTFTLAGNMNVSAPETLVRAANGPINLSTNLSGDGTLLCVNNTVTLNGANTTFTGKIKVGDGRFSGLSINTEARLGANPASFTADQLTLNRGILYTTTTMTIDDANRGIRIGESAGLFNVAPGTTLTLAVPTSSPSSGAALLTAPQLPNPVSGMFIKENTGTLALAHPNNSSCGEILINGGTLAVTGVGRINNGDHHMPTVNNGTLLIDTTANQILSGAISGNGSLIKGNTGMTTLSGTNTFTGAVTVNGGTLYTNAGNAANNRALSFTSAVTVNHGGTLRTSANALFGWDGSQEKPITVNSGATLLADANSDVGLGLLTLNGGTLANSGPSTDWGSFRFDNATDKLVVTADSTVSATHVKFGNAAAAIEVAASRTLHFTGTITNATNGGTSHLRNTGTGTLILANSNTYTGATALEAGTTLVNGSLGNTEVTVANAATLGGTGTIGGATIVHGTHSPDVQSFGSTLTYGSTAKLKWELASNSVAPGNFDKIAAAGAVTITSGATVDVALNASGSGVALNDPFWDQPRSWTFLNGSSVSGSLTLGTISNDLDGRSISDIGILSLQQNATSITLLFTPYTPMELWQQANFGANWNNPAIAGDAVDGDQDGANNLLEYALGSNPNLSSASAVPHSSIDAGKLKMTFTRNSSATDLTLSVMATDDLASTWTEIARSIQGAAFTAIAPGAVVNESGSGQIKDVETTDIHLITDPAHPKRFMRLDVKH
ncbi:MAG: autotransporter-associated beta strand repeat-containing protein [Verrucomicrobiota bacterium]